MPQEESNDFKDPTGLTKWTIRLLYTQMAMGVIAVISNVLYGQLLSDLQEGVYASQEMMLAAIEANEERQNIVGLTWGVIFAVSGILILKWIYRASYNVRQLGASGMAFSPGWSVGWYFIPVANLWKPYQAMKEIWEASASPQDWGTQVIPSLLPWWWFLWIVSNGFASIAFRMMTTAEEVDDFIWVNMFTQLSDVTGIALSLIFIAIIRRSHEMQMSHARVRQNV